MSSDSDSDSSYTTDDSDFNFISGYYEVEVESESKQHQSTSIDQAQEQDVDIADPYADEPIASAEWLSKYEKDMEEEEARRQDLQNRFDGLDAVSNW